jgi:cell division initiation protein
MGIFMGTITPALIKEKLKKKKFSIRFRGFDIKEVDNFLDHIIKELEELNNNTQTLHQENNQLKLENQDYKKRESSMRNTMLQFQKAMDQIKLNAKKTSELIIGNAELEAEKILSNAHKRLSQLHSDIIELKRQRIQLEIQISAVIESHSKMLELTKDENKAADEADSTLRFLKRT